MKERRIRHKWTSERLTVALAYSVDEMANGGARDIPCGFTVLESPILASS
ncbi:ANK_REP_REGION domain-containing protein [Psidium guajava]|nr:ANK_REP_REGION domain-containing protein [Psidium guajava]